MVKKFSALALAALIALPAVAGAAASPAELEAQIERLTRELSALKQDMTVMKEKSATVEKDDADGLSLESMSERAEKWDEAARIQLSGDFRTRLDYVSAESSSHYTALDVGQGVADVLDAGPAFGAVLGAFGMNPDVNTIGDLQAGMQAFFPTPEAFIAAAPGGITTKQATDLAAIFYNPEVGGMLGSMSAAPISALMPYFSDAQHLVSFMKQVSPSARAAIFSNMYGYTAAGLPPGFSPQESRDYDNDTMWTNRLRVNLRAKATEDVEFKARLAMYKAWGMENNPVDYQFNAGNGGGPFMLNSLSFDGNSTRQPEDNALRVDRAFMNWNAIGGSPVWFSIGRRPTTDGPPTHLRMGGEERMATPVAYMDYPFDGASLGYAYKTFFGVEDFPGKVRFCYGRGFESGPQDENANELNDVDFAGLSWDVYDKGNRFFSIQSFAAMNMFNVPDGVDFVNPLELGFWQNNNTKYDPLDPNQNLILDRANLGNIYHTDAVYTSKVQDLNYFLTAGWSRTAANGMDEMGTSLLGSWWEDPSDKDGYSVYVGGRYDIPASPFKVGLEYNYGTKNWISFTPGNDDLYAAKLATRGHVIEAYGIWDIPAGEAVSKFGRAFMRLGYQHYMYDYTGSGFWLGEPLDIDELNSDPLAAQFYTPVDTMDQVYVSLEAWF